MDRKPEPSPAPRTRAGRRPTSASRRRRAIATVLARIACAVGSEGDEVQAGPPTSRASAGASSTAGCSRRAAQQVEGVGRVLQNSSFERALVEREPPSRICWQTSAPAARPCSTTFVNRFLPRAGVGRNAPCARCRDAQKSWMNSARVRPARHAGRYRALLRRRHALPMSRRAGLKLWRVPGPCRRGSGVIAHPPSWPGSTAARELE